MTSKSLFPDLEIYLNRLPTSENYEQSFMHKEEITSLCLSTSTSLIITGSQDGIIKFWKKLFRGIEFTKQYKAHISFISSIVISSNGMKICSMSAFDLTIKVYDALSLDMIDKILLKDLPICVDIAQDFSNPEPYLVISTVNNLFVHLFGISLEMKPMEIHASKVIIVKYNFKYQSC